MPADKDTIRRYIAAALKEADTQLMAGQAAGAMKTYQALLAKVPDQPTALYNLGMLHHRRHELRDAESCLRRALQTVPEDAETKVSLALVCVDLGLADEAQKLVHEAVRLSPKPRLLTKAGALQMECGNIAEARNLFEQAIALDQNHVDAYYALTTLQKILPEDTLFARMKILGENAASLPDAQRIKLEFALGKACLDTGDDAAGFAHYETGNRLKRLGYKNFSMTKIEEYADSIIRLFSPELVARFRNVADEPSKRPVFIVGMPRSGSTLVEQILASHPAVAGMGEVPYLQQSMPVFPNAEVLDYFLPGTASITKKMTDGISAEMLSGISRKYLQLTQAHAPDHLRLTDKMLFNFFWVGIIRLALPHAAVIHCTRDPIATGLSIWQASFSTNIPWAYDQSEIGRYYKAYDKLMAHWNRLFPNEIFNVKYETLVMDQKEQSQRLLEYCGLPWDDKCLRFNENNRSVATASVVQVRQGLHKASLSRWKKYEAYLQPLMHALKENT